ncbi:uncharacterized protein LOC127260514 isoform X2 [Andrographis paniculata]|nr:uncharacterized protein LOC127260514 isoform X2 [Andrographis paniculata]XP_051144211.1 uncharacterized protein LOC127260514 isoform X2 [Andrographis paniculata]
MEKAKLAVGWPDSLLFSTGGFDSHPSSQTGYDGKEFGPYPVGAIDSDEVVMKTLENMIHQNIDTPRAGFMKLYECPLLKDIRKYSKTRLIQMVALRMKKRVKDVIHHPHWAWIGLLDLSIYRYIVFVE